MTSSHLDEVTQYEDSMFYIIHIGKYHNLQHFSLGKTDDIVATELRHTSTFPISNCIYEVPIGRHMSALNALYSHTRALRTNSPVNGYNVPADSEENWMIVMDSYEDVVPLLEKADILFKARTRFGLEE